MRFSDVLRGCLASYATCVLVGAFIATARAAPPSEVVGGFFLALLILGGYGLLFLVPATLLAFLSYGALRLVLKQAFWWQAILVMFAWASLLMLALEVSLASLLAAGVLGVGLGGAFWIGSAGMRWSVPLADTEVG